MACENSSLMSIRRISPEFFLRIVNRVSATTKWWRANISGRVAKENRLHLCKYASACYEHFFLFKQVQAIKCRATFFYLLNVAITAPRKVSRNGRFFTIANTPT